MRNGTWATSYLLTKRSIVVYFVLAAAISVVLAVLAPFVSAVVLGVVALALLSLVGLLLLRRESRRIDPRPRWSDRMPCYFTVQDKDYRVIYGNQPFMQDFGHRGEHCYEAYKGNTEPCNECPVMRSFSDGQVHTGEENVLSRDGRVTDVLVSAAPLRDHHGKVTSVIKMATDITEVKHLRRELEQTRSDFERLFSAVPCFICVQNREHRIIEANALYRREFGPVERSRCWEVCKQRSSQCTDCIVDQTFADGESHSSEEVLVTRDGRRINVVVHTMPVVDDSGMITAVMEVYTDITEVKRLQRQLALMGRAVAGMAHRIKNIVMGLEGGIFVVNTGMELDEKETVNEGWEMVERNVKRVSRIVRDLLYCAKDRTPDLADDVDAGEILREVVALYEERAIEEGIELRSEVSEPVPRGRFDPEALHSLLCNLVANAIDACRFDQAEDKNGHAIVLRCRPAGNSNVVLEVEDNGAGIPEELNSKVFEDYFSSKGTEGTGIGLLVVQQVTEEHGGKVSFSSRPGKGTVFTVTLPTTANPKESG